MGFSSMAGATSTTKTGTGTATLTGTPTNTPQTGTMMGSVGMGLQIGGMASSVIGAYYSTQTQKHALQAQADIAEINAKMSESAAQSALLAGQKQEQSSRMATSQKLASQRTRTAASGVDLGQGSAAEALASTELVGEMDANTIHANAVRSAWGYRTQSANSQNQALMTRAQADSMSPTGNAATTLMASAGQVAQSWYKWRQNSSGGSF